MSLLIRSINVALVTGLAVVLLAPPAGAVARAGKLSPRDLVLGDRDFPGWSVEEPGRRFAADRELACRLPDRVANWVRDWRIEPYADPSGAWKRHAESLAYVMPNRRQARCVMANARAYWTAPYPRGLGHRLADPGIRLGDETFALDGDVDPGQNDSHWALYWRQGRIVAAVIISGHGTTVPTADPNRFEWAAVRFPLSDLYPLARRQSDLIAEAGFRAHEPPPRVFTKTCADSARRLIGTAPSRRVRRAGGPQVRLRAVRSGCSERRQLTGAAARRALRLPEVPAAAGEAPAPAGCLVPSDAVGLGLTGVLLSRRSWCSPVDQIDARALVIVVTPGGVERRIVGTGRVALLRRIDLDRRGGGGRAQIDLGYLGLTGTIARSATFEVRVRCEFAFGTTCAAIPRSGPEVALMSGGLGQVVSRLEPGAIPGGGRDVMQAWVELRLRAFVGGLGPPVVVGAAPRPRCDSEGPRQGCVWTDFAPTMIYSTGQTPEIAAHITQAQAAGLPGARASGRPLTRVSRAAARDNRREVCPRSLVKRYRRARPGGSCDEYPFASTRQGGRGASTANVLQREQNVQGGIIAGFYSSERVLRGDAYWVGVTP